MGVFISFILAISFMVIILNSSKASTYPVYPSSTDDLYYLGFYKEETIPSGDNENINEILKALNQVGSIIPMEYP